MQDILRGLPEAGDGDEIDAAASMSDRVEADFHDHLIAVGENFLGEPSTIDDLPTPFDGWRALRGEVIELSRAGNHDDAVALIDRQQPEYIGRMMSKSDALVQFCQHRP